MKIQIHRLGKFSNFQNNHKPQQLILLTSLGKKQIIDKILEVIYINNSEIIDNLLDTSNSSKILYL